MDFSLWDRRSASSVNSKRDKMLLDNLEEFRRRPDQMNYVIAKINPVLSTYETQQSFFEAVTLMLGHCFNCGPNFYKNYVLLFQEVGTSVISNEKHQLVSVKDALTEVFFKPVEITQSGFEIFQKKLAFAVDCLNSKVFPVTVFKSVVTSALQLSNSSNEAGLRFQFEILRCVHNLAENRVVAWNGKAVGDLNLDLVVMRLKAALLKNMFTDRTIASEVTALLNAIKEKKWWQPIEMPSLEANTVVDLTTEPSTSSLHRQTSRPSTGNTGPTRTQQIDLSQHVVQIQRSRPTQLLPRRSLPLESVGVPSRLPLPSPVSQQPKQLVSPQSQSIRPPTSSSATTSVAFRLVQQQQALQISATRQLQTPQQQQSLPQMQLQPQSQPNLPPPLLPLPPTVAFKTLVGTLVMFPERLLPITKETLITLTKEPATRQSFSANVGLLIDAILADHSDAELAVCIKLVENLQNFEFHPFQSPSVTFREVVSKIVVTSPPIPTMEQCSNFCGTLRLTRELYRMGLVPRNVFEFYINSMAKEDNEVSSHLICEVSKHVDALVDAQIAQLTDEELQFWDGITDRLSHLLKTCVYEPSLSGSITAFLDSLHEKGGFRRKICCCKAEPIAEDPPNLEPSTSSNAVEVPSTSVSRQVPPVAATGQAARIVAITPITPVQPLTVQTEVLTSTSNSITSSPTASHRPTPASSQHSPDLPTPPTQLSGRLSGPSMPSAATQLPTSPVRSVPTTITPRNDQPPPRPQPLASRRLSTFQFSSNQQEAAIQQHFRSFVVRTLTSVAEEATWLNQLKDQLKSLPTQLFSFTSALTHLFVKLFELAYESAQEVAKICIDLCKTDHGRGKNFAVELEQFCLRYVTCRNKTDFDRAKTAVETDSDRAETLAALMCPALEEGGKTLSEDIALLEQVFQRRRIGCVRLIGQLILIKHLEFKTLIAFADSLLAASNEQTLECLLELLADIGEDLPPIARANEKVEWFISFFSELTDIKTKAGTPEKVKKLVSDILLEKNSWPDIDPKREVRRKLKSLLDSLTPDLAKTPSYKEQLDQIQQLITSEFPDEHARDCFEIYQKKINKLLKTPSNDGNNSQSRQLSRKRSSDSPTTQPANKRSTLQRHSTSQQL